MKIIGWRFKWIDDGSPCNSMLCIQLSPRWSMHFGVQRSSWVFGHYTEPYDLCADTWGIGPIFHVSRWNGLLEEDMNR